MERGERGSTEEHLTVTQFKVQAEQQRLEAVTGQEMCIRDRYPAFAKTILFQKPWRHIVLLRFQAAAAALLAEGRVK